MIEAGLLTPAIMSATAMRKSSLLRFSEMSFPIRFVLTVVAGKRKVEGWREDCYEL